MSRTLETKQKKEYNRLKGWWDPCLKTWGFEKFMPWVTQSHCLRREKICKNSFQDTSGITDSVSEILSVDPPIFRQYLPALALY